MSYTYYKVIAQNKQGATIEFNGHTQKMALDKFDNEYTRKGFKITITKNGELIKTIKKTYK
jgi:hypothetical protein